MDGEYLYFSAVYKRVRKTKKQIYKVVNLAKKKHPFERWYDRLLMRDGDIISAYAMEFVDWLEEVHYATGGTYLEREIKFYEKRIKQLEEELNIAPSQFKLKKCLLKDIPMYFDKDKSTIKRVIKKMRNANGGLFESLNDKGLILISPEGMLWLAQNCFRKKYLEYLEIYKRSLQKKKEELD